MIYLVLYRNKKNKNIFRLVKVKPLYDIDDETSMGWYVVTIQILYDKRFMLLKTYHTIKYEEYKIKQKKQLRKEKIIRFLDILFKWFYVRVANSML